MDRYGNRGKENHVDLSELKICCVVARSCRKPVLIALVTPSKPFLGSAESGVQDKTAQEVLISYLSDLEGTHYHHSCGRSFCN